MPLHQIHAARTGGIGPPCFADLDCIQWWVGGQPGIDGPGKEMLKPVLTFCDCDCFHDLVLAKRLAGGFPAPIFCI